MLASVQKVLEVHPIENADAIERIKVLGWQLVAKKGEFAPGDLCVYCEIDSILPENPEFEFLRARHFRIKTIKLRGVLSQGIAFPLSFLPAGEWKEGDDVTEIIGVQKYEKPVPLNMKGIVKGSFPGYVPKTDEVRVQSVPEVVNEFVNAPLYITVKLDGTSATYAHKNGEFDVCSRNLSLKEDETNIYWKLAAKYDLLNKLKQKGNYALQVEICGPGIQKNPAGLKEVDIFAFNVFNIDEARYLDFEEFKAFCEDIGVPVVPVIDARVVFKEITLEELLEMAKGVYEGTKTAREGIVIRPVKETYSETIKGRLSVKVCSNDYLLKE